MFRSLEVGFYDKDVNKIYFTRSRLLFENLQFGEMNFNSD